MFYVTKQAALKSKSILRLNRLMLRTSGIKFKIEVEESNKNQVVNRLKEEEPFKSYAKHSENLKHFASTDELVIIEKDGKEYTLAHPIWSPEEVEGVEVTHRKPKDFTDGMAYNIVNGLRLSFDLLSGYSLKIRLDTLDEKAVLNR